jgi:hypothetical protein
MVNAPLIMSPPEAEVRMEPGGRALDTSRMAEMPPGSSYNGNLAGASFSPAFAPAIFILANASFDAQ